MRSHPVEALDASSSVHSPPTGPPGRSTPAAARGERPARRRAKRLASLAVGVPLALALALPATSGAAISAPHFVNVFPSRDFVHLEGYNPGQDLTVTVHHDPDLVTSLSNPGLDASATGTVGADGILEINHVGGTCWPGFTPDIRPGDTVSVKDAASGALVDDMVVQNVAGKRPVQTAADTLEVHGTAQNKDGSRPDVAVLSSRLISPTRFFANGGKRNLNAPSVTYDSATGNAWTATYAGLTPEDVATGLEADTSAAWVVTDPTGATPLEQTSQETGANAIAGPTTGCTARLEKVQVTGSETVPPSVPANVAATVQGANTVHLTWDPSSDPISTPPASGVQTYEVLRDAHDGKGPIAVATVQNADGSNNPPTTYDDVNVPPATYTYSVRATDAANNDSAAGIATPDVTTTANGAPAPPVPVSEPPAGGHSIIGFPARDFISADGYADSATVDVFIIRGGNIVSSAKDIVPQGATGLVEVNHPGGGCWNGVTPWLHAGDVIQTQAKHADGTVFAVDQTTVSNVTAQRPVQTGPNEVTIHGTAADANGNQIAIDQIEQRLVTSTANSFALNGKRTIRAASAGADGTLSYDSATSTRWTAVYKGLSADDVTRALGAESRAIWLGSAPLAGAELTIFENGDAVGGGPGAPCTTPAEPQPQVSFDATALDMGSVDVVDQTKDRSTKTVTLTNTGDLPLKVDQAYIAGVDAQSFTVSRSTCDNTTVPVGGTCQADVTFNPSNTGTTTASLNFADNAKIIGFQNIPLKGVGIAGKATPSVTTLAFNTVTAGTPLTKTLTVTNTGDAPLDVTPSITGAASADYSIVAAQTTCAQLAPAATCTIAVQFDPQAIGSRTATLEIPNDTGVNSRVALTGTGAGSTFTVGPNPVTFGNVTRGTTKTQTVTVKNSGSLAFTVTSAKVTSPDPAVVSAYTVTGTGCVGTVLAPGKTCNITVALKPVTARFYTATLEVAGDKTTLPRPGVVKTTLNATGV